MQSEYTQKKMCVSFTASRHYYLLKWNDQMSLANDQSYSLFHIQVFQNEDEFQNAMSVGEF